MKFTKIAGAIALLTLVAACSGGSRLFDAEATSPGGDAFSKAMYGEYVKLAKAEYAEGDYTDADHFAERAIASAGGKPPTPEQVSDRKQTAGNAKALEAARKRLMAAFGGGAKGRLPADSARAQAMFDCWAQEQEENIQSDDIDACRIGFFAALARLERTEMAAPAPAPSPAPATPAPKPSPITYIIYFGFNSTALGNTANSVLDTAAEVVKDSKPVVISVIGHTDKAGASNYNAALAEKRANIVADALQRRGVSPQLMTIGALGENAPAVQTKDDIKASENRRVEVTVRY